MVCRHLTELRRYHSALEGLFSFLKALSAISAEYPSLPKGGPVALSLSFTLIATSFYLANCVMFWKGYRQSIIEQCCLLQALR